MGSISQSTPFGKPMREHFLFDKNFRNLNHGSFGTYPHAVLTSLRHFQALAEAGPDKFMRYTYSDLLLGSRRGVSSLLHAPLDTCVFVQNATLGINTVLRNLLYQPQKDVIVYFDTIYAACEKTIFSILETNPSVTARKVEGYEFPCEHEEVVARFVDVVQGLQREGLRAKVAVFDTICAVPGLRFPFERLTEECRRLGVLSCIDAAHGIGHIPLDLAGLDPDFLVSNCHKWLFTPRGCALFYVPFRNQHLIRTTYPTSHGYMPPSTSQASIRNPLPASAPNTTPFTDLFQFVATTDNAPYYCVPAARKFREEVCGGEENLVRYLRESMRKGGDRVAEILGTEVMENRADRDGARGAGSLRDCAFANVRLPLTISSPPLDSNPAENEKGQSEVRGAIAQEEVGKVVDYMQETFVHEFDTFIAVYEYKGRLWARLSGQVYLDLSDWEWCASVLGEVCARVREGRFRGEDVGVEHQGGNAAKQGKKGGFDGGEEVEEEEENNGIKDIAEGFKGFHVEME